ncbi:DUF1304 domain-containing protein [Leuconostoc inhae]|uniref:DUF1304 domain-containing protein n=1 Tax=Leuconostoc inhae TaxID=178001 RepID=UPI001C7D4BD0|nr:DUF1304 domain-containing protein [Leuconostoc inhae]
MLAYFITGLVAVEAIGIMFIEIFGSPKQQAKAFDLDESFVKIPATKSLLGNQGIYNGLLGVLIFGTMFLLDGPQQILMLEMEMAFIIIAAIYGGLTATRKIILIQGLPAMIALIALYLK